LSSYLTPAERDLLAQVPKVDIEEMAFELDLLLEATYDRDEVLGRCVEALLERAAAEGLPFTKYDLDDLQELPRDDLAALARVIGVPGRADPAAVIKHAAKAVKLYEKTRPRSAVVLLLPTLLRPLARAARSRPPR
jgi:hypothetical protein